MKSALAASRGYFRPVQEGAETVNLRPIRISGCSAAQRSIKETATGAISSAAKRLAAGAGYV